MSDGHDLPGFDHDHGLPEGVRVSRRGGSEVWMNFNQEPVALPDGATLAPVSFQLRG